MSIKKGLDHSWKAWGHWNNIKELLSLVGYWPLLPGGGGGALTFLWAATDGWSPPAVWLASLAAATLCAVLVAAIRIALVYNRTLSTKPSEDSNKPSVQGGSAALKKKLPQSRELPSLLSLFMTEFVGKGSGGLSAVWRGYSDITLPDQTTSRVLFNVVEDHNSMSKFLALFVPQSPKTFDICSDLSKHYINYLKPPLGIRTGAAHLMSETDSKDVVFTGRVFLYFETGMSISQLGKLEEAFQQNGARVEFRSTSYAMDVFNAIRAGDGKPPPRFELKDGLPVEVSAEPKANDQG
jgi:hypothetical protein